MMRVRTDAAVPRRRAAIAALIAVAALVAGGMAARGTGSAQTPAVPGKPAISSVTAGDRQLTVNWSAATAPGDKPVVDYQVMYRAGSSGAWSTASSYSISYDSAVQTGDDTTWAHDRNPLDLGTVTGAVAAYIERTKGGRHKLDGVYRVKQAVAAVRIRVNGETDGAGTLRAKYTTSPITDLRHNGASMGRNVVVASATSFELTGVATDLLADSSIWVDGWDHTSTNTAFPEFDDISVSERRLRIDIDTASTATSANISRLTNLQPYEVRVRARNSAGWGAWSDVSTGTPLGTPEAPTGLETVSGSAQFAVSWTAPVNNGGYTISDYDIQYRAATGADTWGAWTAWQASTVSTATAATINSGIADGTTYQVRVRAVNSAGGGGWSDAVTDTAGKPSPPAFTLSTVRRPLPQGKSDRGGLLSMTFDAAANGSPLTDYDLRYRESGTSTWYTYRDRSHDSGKISANEATSNSKPIDFGDSFLGSPGGVQVTREAIGSNDGLYKFSKAVDVLWIRLSGAITGGGTIYGRWHSSKPTAATLSTLGTQIFSATTESDGTFWQDGWVTDLPANGYIWFYTAEAETLTKRRLQLDFTDNTARAPQVNDTGTLTASETVGLDTNNVVDPIDFGTFTTPSGGVAVTRESVTYNNVTKQGYYKIGEAATRLWVRVSGTFSGTGQATVIGCWSNSKPTDPRTDCASVNQQVFSVKSQSVGGNNTFEASGWVYNLPVSGYLWFYAQSLLESAITKTLTEYRLQLDFDRGRIVLSGLQNGKTYELQARARNARGWGAWGNASGTAGAPTRPVADAPTAKHQALAVTWAAPASDNGAAVGGYDVRYRAGSSGAWASWPHFGTGRSATITGLTNDTEYAVQVRARNSRGDGFWSDAVKGAPAPQKPEAPAAPTLTSSGATMTVNWTAPLANGADITDYDIEYSSDGGTTWAPALDGSYDLAANTSFTTNTTIPLDFGALSPSGITVTRESVGSNQGVYTIGQTLGALKVYVSATATQDGTIDVYYADTKPAAATLRSHGAKLFSLTLSQNVEGSGSGTIPTPAANSYFWAVGASAVTTSTRTISLDWPSISTSATQSISSLTSGTTYQVRVRARNSVGAGDWSPASTHVIGRPSAPAAPTLTTGNARLTAAWTAASGNGSAITDYDVRYCSSGCDRDASWTSLPDVTDSTALTAAITGLSNGVTYQVQVRAQNATGAGPWSPASSLKAGLPARPAAPTVSAGDSFLRLDWTAPADNGSRVTRYDARHCSASCESGDDDVWEKHSVGTSPGQTGIRWELRDLTNGTEYYVQVRAKNAHGDGEWSPWVKATPGAPATPSAPTLIAGDHKIIAEWPAPADNGSAITDYDVRYSADGGAWTALPDATASTERMAVITGLTTETTYRVQVRATNARGDSAWSGSGTHALAVSPVPTLTFHYCDPDGLNQLWIDYACFIKAGQHGAKPFDTVAVRGSGGDYVEVTNPAVGMGQVLAYNPQGGLAIVETRLAGVVQDVFLVDVIRFGIRDVTITPTNNTTGTLTVRLHSPSHSSPDIFDRNGVDYSRSWAQLSLPQNALRGNTHDGNNPYGEWVYDPIQVVGQNADSITFDLLVLMGGTYTITVNAYRSLPDADCTEQGDLRCFTPPEPHTVASYTTSQTASATFAAPPPPATPASVSVTRADGTLTASWPSIAGAASYHVTYSSNGGANWSLAALHHPAHPGATTSITIGGADNGKTYIVAVRAKNSSGGSGWRNSPPAGPYVPPQPPATPGAITVTRADGTLTASWDAVSGATSYHVTYTSDNGASWSLAAYSHPNASITIGGADNGKTYIVGVRARNSSGGSGWRNSPAAGPYTPPPPPAPTGLTATAGDGSVTLSWDDPSDSSITGYEYRVNHNATGTGNFSGWSDWTAIPSSGAGATSHTLTSLTNGAEYRYRVRAVNASGAGAAAPSANPWYVSATPQAAD